MVLKLLIKSASDYCQHRRYETVLNLCLIIIIIIIIKRCWTFYMEPLLYEATFHAVFELLCSASSEVTLYKQRVPSLYL